MGNKHAWVEISRKIDRSLISFSSERNGHKFGYIAPVYRVCSHRRADDGVTHVRETYEVGAPIYDHDHSDVADLVDLLRIVEKRMNRILTAREEKQKHASGS